MTRILPISLVPYSHICSPKQHLLHPMIRMDFHQGGCNDFNPPSKSDILQDLSHKVGTFKLCIQLTESSSQFSHSTSTISKYARNARPELRIDIECNDGPESWSFESLLHCSKYFAEYYQLVRELLQRPVNTSDVRYPSSDNAGYLGEDCDVSDGRGCDWEGFRGGVAVSIEIKRWLCISKVVFSSTISTGNITASYLAISLVEEM